MKKLLTRFLGRAMVIPLLICTLGVAVFPAQIAQAVTPAGSFTISGPTQPVSPGTNFDIIVSITSNVPVVSGLVSLLFDPAKAECTGAVEGSFLSTWAQANSPAMTMFLPGAPKINNTVGNVTGQGVTIMGAPEPYGPTGTGQLLIFKMKAKSGVSGNTSFSLTTLRIGIVTNPPSVENMAGVIVTNNGFPVTIGDSGSGSGTSAPAITGFSPMSGGQGTNVTISGSNLGGAIAVMFGGTSAVIKSNNATTIIAAVGSGATGKVSVTTAGGTANSTSSFTFTAAASPPTTPAISSFTPVSAGTGGSVMITGVNFTNATNVKFGGIAAQSFTVDSATQITAKPASGASGNVTVTTPGGTATKAGFTFVVASSSPANPAISGFTPASVGSGGSVVITGANFTGATAIKFGGIAAQSFTVDSATQITAKVGSGASGNVSITTPAGTATKSGFAFTTNLNSASPASPVGANPPITTSPTQAVPGASTSLNTTPQMPANPSPTASATTGNATTTAFAIPAASSLASRQNPVFQTGVPSSPAVPAGGASAYTIDVLNATDTGGLFLDNVIKRDIYSGAGQGITAIEIKKGTRALTAEGRPLDLITITPVSDTPQPPQSKSLIGAFQFGPSGATFSTPVDVIFEFDPAQLPAKGINGLTLAYFDTTGNKWQICDYTVDVSGHRIIARISHFSLYSIFTDTGSGINSNIIPIAIIISEFLLCLIGILFYLHYRGRKRVISPALSQAHVAYGNQQNERPVISFPMNVRERNDPSTSVWGYVTPENVATGQPANTGENTVSSNVGTDGLSKSIDIEIGNRKINVRVTYDPEMQQRAAGGKTEYEKSKEYEK